MACFILSFNMSLCILKIYSTPGMGDRPIAKHQLTQEICGHTPAILVGFEAMIAILKLFMSVREYKFTQ